MIINTSPLDFFEPVETPLVFTDHKGKPYNPKGYIVPSEYLLGNINRDHPLWRQLVETIAAKKQQRILVPELETNPVTPETIMGLKRVFMGTGESKTIFAQNTGRLDCRYMPPSTGGIGNSELARSYIKLCLAEANGKVARCNYKRYEEYLTYPAPLYYEPGTVNGRHRGDYAMVDISSAYWTIHKSVTIDLKFEPGRWILLGRTPYRHTEEVTAYRGMRHAIPGMLAAAEMAEYRYGKRIDYKFPDKLSYPGIIGYTYHVMHAIAREVIDHFDAAMVLTDAYIVPRDRAEELVRFLRERWGVTGVVKARGYGALYEMNVYQIGTYRSRNAPAVWTDEEKWSYIAESGREMTHICKSTPKNNLLSVDTSWLQRGRSILGVV